jgi:hypothetical protein
MPTPSSNKRAVLTARVARARVGAIRCGFTPKDTRATGGFYVWTMVRGVDALDSGGAGTSWTTVKS